MNLQHLILERGELICSNFVTTQILSLICYSGRESRSSKDFYFCFFSADDDCLSPQSEDWGRALASKIESTCTVSIFRASVSSHRLSGHCKFCEFVVQLIVLAYSEHFVKSNCHMIVMLNAMHVYTSIYLRVVNMSEGRPCYFATG